MNLFYIFGKSIEIYIYEIFARNLLKRISDGNFLKLLKVQRGYMYAIFQLFKLKASVTLQRQPFKILS